MCSLKKFVALLIITLCVGLAISDAKDDITPLGFDNPRTTVVIYNDLGGPVSLQYHCKSRDDDF